MKITKKHIKKYALDALGWLLIVTGTASFVLLFPGSTYLILTGLSLIIGKRSVNKIKYKFLPWLKKKHAIYKKRRGTK